MTPEAALGIGAAESHGQLRKALAVADSAQARETWLLIAASLLATVPVWLSSFPPMVDLPEHAAQVALLHNLHNPGFAFASLFWVNWFTPYLFGYMLVYALAPVLGIVVACKVVVAISAAALPLSTAVLMKETGADRYWALLTIPAMYGFSYNWGFLNFLVATPIGLLFLALFIRHTRKPALRSTVYLALLSIVLFFSHALIYLFFGMIACLYALLDTRNVRRTILAISPMAAAVPLTALWFLRTKSDPGVQDPVFWDLNWIAAADPHLWGGRITGFFPRLLGFRPEWFCVLFGIALFVLPFLAGVRLSRRPAVWMPLAVCVAVILFAPTGGHSAWAVAQRFTVFTLPFFVIGLEKRPVERSLWRATAVFLLVGWSIIIAAATVRYNAEAKGFTQVLSAMEPNQRVLSLMFNQEAAGSRAPLFVHFPAWYSATKQGVVDMNFAVFPVALVRYRPSASQQTPTFSEWHPETFHWGQWHGATYRYFVVHSPVDLGYRLFAWAPCPVSLVERSGNWWLYEKDSRCTPAGEP